MPSLHKNVLRIVLKDNNYIFDCKIEFMLKTVC